MEKLNRLAREQSPYLLQHASNPVDWYSWGEEALLKAKRENKPIFLSIGYSACHWCHVMEKESFQDHEVAEILNREFVPIKVDREERPDIDQIYMAACQAINGSGGWPLSLFLTPEKKPFFAGTYFPKISRHPETLGFLDLLNKVAIFWKSDQDQVELDARSITEAIESMQTFGGKDEIPGVEVLEQAYLDLHRNFDHVYGGFGHAPKFPMVSHLSFLIRWYLRRPDCQEALGMAEKNLTAMYEGGIHDHLGSGFCRYSVDRTWLVPHFEKMLYDQALLTTIYLEAFQVTGNALFAQVAEATIDYVLRELIDESGAFYAAQSAESEGGEGLFYTWTYEEITTALQEPARSLFCERYDVRRVGNFEKRNILHIKRSVAELATDMNLSERDVELFLQQARQTLFRLRQTRVPPAKDDKILVSWNSLMISALAKSATILKKESYLVSAQRALRFILDNMYGEQGLLRRFRNGHKAHAAFLDDYAFLIQALLDLYETTFEPDYLSKAVSLSKEMVKLFADEENGGFYFTSEKSERLFIREKETHDGSVPSGASVACLSLLKLAMFTGDDMFTHHAEAALRYLTPLLKEHPPSLMHTLLALDYRLGPATFIHIVTKGDDVAKHMIEAIRLKLRPHVCVQLSKPEWQEELAKISSHQMVEQKGNNGSLCMYKRSLPAANN